MRHKARDIGDEFTLLLLLCSHIGLLFGKRLDTNLLCHWIRKYPDSPVHRLSDSVRIFIFFSTLESGFKNVQFRCRIRRVRVDGSPEEKKLRIQKYPDTCGRGVRQNEL